MDTTLNHAIERQLPEHGRVIAQQPVAGGCISQALRVTFADGFACFAKSNRACPEDMFTAEAMGLHAMRCANAVRVPEVLAVAGGDQESPPLLLLEWVAAGQASTGWQAALGRQLAQMHLAPPCDAAPADNAFGFAADNYLGATPQSNRSHTSWCEFWRTQRLEPQLRMAHAASNSALRKLGDRLLERLDDWLDRAERPAMLHGDLWSGNYYMDGNGAPVLIDPACYYGSREAEFGMIRLFGGLGPEFQRAYEEVAPWDAGADERIEIYRLHHLLNHLNLFGSSYLSDCIQALQKLVG